AGQHARRIVGRAAALARTIGQLTHVTNRLRPDAPPNSQAVRASWKQAGTAYWRWTVTTSGGFPPSPFIDHFIQIFFRDWIAVPLAVPQDSHHLPCITLPHELKAVDPSREWLFPRRAARFVGAEHVRDVAERFDSLRDRRLEEAVLFKIGGR